MNTNMAWIAVEHFSPGCGMPGPAVAMRAKVHGDDIAAVGLAVIAHHGLDRTSKSSSRTIIDMTPALS
jgi:hypothetical protein